MRRWNGWGDEAVAGDLSEAALAYLRERIGAAEAPRDATLAEACAGLPASRLPKHALLDRTMISGNSSAVRCRYCCVPSMEACPR